MPKSSEPRVTTKMRFMEASLVDVGAMEDARVVIRKRADAPIVDTRAKVSKRAAITSETDGHAHLLNLECYNGIATSGTTSYDGGHQHPWIMGDDGSIELAMVNGHTHEVEKFSVLAVITKVKPKDDEDEDAYLERFMGDEKTSGEFPDKKQRAAVAHSMFKDHKKKRASKAKAGDPADANGGEAPMADESKLAEMQKSIDAANTRARRAEVMADLPSDQQAFAKSLPAEERNAFLDGPATDRAARVAKAAEADPIVFTAANGRTFRKSADPVLVEMARSNDTLMAKAAAAEERELVATFKSRAQAEIPNLPMDADAGATLLRAVEGIKDEKHRGLAKAALVAANEALSPAFKRLGTSAAPSAAKGEVEALEAVVQKVKAASPGMTDAQARAAAIRSPEGRAAFKKLRDAQVEAATA